MSKRYEITSLIEQDRLGEVFMAQDITLQRKVVFRKFKCDQQHVLSDEFTQYTGKLCALQHPNLLTIFDIGRNQEGPFMVTQFVEGEKLDARLLEGPLSQTGVYNMASDLLDALHAMHVAGVIHGALRSDSVIRLPRVSGGHRYLIVDLGLDKIVSMICGQEEHGADPVLTAPELLDGTAEANEQTDLFALGQLCYIALAGGHPMAESSPEECLKIYRESGVANLGEYASETQQDFADWVMGMIAVDPEQRPKSTVEAMAQLHAIKLNAPAPNVPGVTQAVVEVAPSVAPQMSQAVTVSAELESNSAVSKLKALPKNVKIIAGLVAAIVVVLLVAVMGGGSGDKKAGSDGTGSNQPVFLTTPEMIQVMADVSDPQLVELDSAQTLDWSVIKGVPSSSEKSSKTQGGYISGIFPSGDFDEFEMAQAPLIFEGNGVKIAPRGAMTNVKKGTAEFGQGWEITLRIPKSHSGPVVVDLYMLQDECDFDVSVTLPKGKEVIQMKVSYDAVGAEPGIVKIPVVIPKPVGGGFYTIKILSASEDASAEFGMALSAVHVRRR